MKTWLSILALAILGACATPKPYNYEMLQQKKPVSILVLPPTNRAPDLRGTYSVLSTLSAPIGERGYYVFPVEIVDKFMKDNGLPSADEMHQVSLKKLDEVFGPDAVLYVQITDYGTDFKLLDSVTKVKFTAKLVHTKTGTLLWNGNAVMSQTASQRSGNNNAGLLGMIVNAAVAQAVDTSVDYAHQLAQGAGYQLLWNNMLGLPYGPLHPKFAGYQPVQGP